MVCAFKLKINKYAYELKKSQYIIVLFPCSVKRGYLIEISSMIISKKRIGHAYLQYCIEFSCSRCRNLMISYDFKDIQDF